ncbi:Retrovirus-related Pol polyprotein from transposon RE1 [Bienertia sinuspersici]
MAGIFCLLSSVNSGWILDSGVTDYMCYDLSLFEVLDELYDKTTYITIPDGTKLPITHAGTIKFNRVCLLLVFCMCHISSLILFPFLSCADLDCSAIFTDSKCLLQGPLMRQLHPGSLKNGLYYLQDGLLLSDNSHSSSAVHIAHTESLVSNKAKLWHIRLGHLPFSQLKHLSVFSNNHKDSHVDDICQICPMSRQTRLVFPSSSIKSVAPFQLLHLDIWGPYHVCTHNGCKSFLTIVDDFSRMTWVHMLHFKSDVSQIFEHFVKYVDTH